MNWGEFFHMGGYAVYVWTSWGLTAAVLLWQFMQPKLAAGRIRREIMRQIARQRKLQADAAITTTTTTR